MRLTFPTRIPLAKTVALAGAMVCIQRVEHTDFAFSLLFFAFVVLSVVNFNLAGGFSKPSGAYVFFFATLTVIVGVFVKALVGEPADSNLEAPLLTMSVYTAAMAVMMVPILLNRMVTWRAPGLGVIVGSDRVNLFYSALGCMIIGVGIFGLNFVSTNQSGSFLSALNQINGFLPLGIILATIDVVKKSDGRKSLSVLSVAGILFLFGTGLIGFSKQGMFTPFVAWVVGVTYGRLRVRPIHVLSTIGFGVLAFMVLTPISQVGRAIQSASLEGRVAVIWGLVENLGQTRLTFEEDQIPDPNPDLRHGYYSVPVGLAARLNMISPDDGLINYTDHHGAIGYAPVPYYFSNWVPHFLEPNKGVGEIAYGGNYYAHEIGGYLAADDFTTGISFSALGEAFNIGRWTAILLLLPLLWLMLFVTTDMLCGDLRRTPWGLLAVLLFSHMAPEGAVSGIIYFTWFANIGIVIAIFFCVYVAPIIGSLFGTSVNRSQGFARPRMRAAMPGVARSI